MSIRKIIFEKEQFYHIYNRGNSKQQIFQSMRDEERFMEILYLCNTNSPINIRNINRDTENIYSYNLDDKIVTIVAYCLMPNHFHILLSPINENGIQLFMQKLSTAYVMYYNKKYERTGSLFEGKFKSTHADSDDYLRYLFSYIHLNPIKIIESSWKESGIKNKQKALEFLKKYNSSSYIDWENVKRNENLIIKKEAFEQYLDNSKELSKELIYWLYNYAK